MNKRPFFAQRKLGFRRNPFCALTEREWIETAFVPPAFPGDGCRPLQNLQLIGQEGCGKSSLLRGIGELMRQSGLRVVYEYIPEGQRSFLSALHEADVFVLDEAQRLSLWQKRRWLGWLHGAPKRRTLFATHRDLSGWFKKRGLALVSFDVAAAVTLQTYARWLDGRMRYFALGEEPPLGFTADAAALLCDWFGADMRAAEYFLYDVFQEMELRETITAAYLHKARQRYRPKTRSSRHG